MSKKRIGLKNILIGVLIVYVLGIFINQQITMSKIKSEKSKKVQELNQVNKTKKELQDEVNMCKDDKYIEKLAREKLNLIKKGETPVINSSNKK
ncbi:septum formation initiator family protein [Haloimpatiens sp. FM7330]|uniref:FtsB family cell division protein n=1 Tax=Haloimpatiens sp. FM7330 TaxID=3298610 RepID=UPI00362CDC12